MHDIFQSKNVEELHRSLLSEVAKAKNEIACARGDLDKANSRLQFLIALCNHLIERSQGD